MESVLRIEEVSKSFSGLEVLHQVNFNLNKGEIHALVGENGAGKSTLMKIFMGEYKPDFGRIYLNNKNINIPGPAKALELGIAMVHQELHYMKYLSIADYMLLGREPRKIFFVDNEEKIRLTNKYLDEIGLNISPHLKMGDLSVSEIQMIEIAKVLSYGSRILILDEPTSSLSEGEAKRLFEILLNLKKQGVSIIYISHRLEELFKIADKVTILRDGKVIDSKFMNDISRDMMINMMVGRRLEEIFPSVNTNLGEELISVHGLSKNGEFDNVSFDVSRGEVLGLAGLVGAGRTEIVTSIFGEKRFDKGTIKIDGQPIRIKNSQHAVKKGIAFITEDRKKYGLNLLGNVKDNISVLSYKEFSKLGFINKKEINKNVNRMIELLNIKTNTDKQMTLTLSGGNQQKVVLAKWLLTSPDIIIFDEPTRGIDVGAKAEIYKIINKLAKEGKAIIVISSELPEIIGLCNRVIVLRRGKITGELCSSEITQEKIMHLASG